MDAMLIRPRRDGDLTACAGLVREVHAADRYPRHLPADLTSFLRPADPYGIWVAERDGEILGHIALVPRSVPAAMELAAGALGRRADQLAVVARLFVSPPPSPCTKPAAGPGPAPSPSASRTETPSESTCT